MQMLANTSERHKALSLPEIHAITKIEGELLKGARRYFEGNGFWEVVVPHITRATGACENIATMFDVDFFGDRAFLVQTGQLYLESLIPFMERLYCVGSSFRSEPDVDERHLTEFTLVEMELPCDLDGLIGHIENIICSMIKPVTDNRMAELKTLNVPKDHINMLRKLRPPFNRITYMEAVNLLKNQGVKWGDDLKSRHEKRLMESLGNKPLFITHFPKAIKFFNMRENTGNPSIVNSTDCILPYSGEAVGAAEREHEHDKLYKRLSESAMLRQLEQRGGSIADFGWYLDTLKDGRMIPHAGCGIGLNRVTQFAIASGDIRMSTTFPQNRESLM
ncbi:MAG: hypothetical protein HY367_03865 [Candidatus Aenigmarchaeota archaeon]|nr:hypothetical protein [Candidatus Aenigmarchaeota archaeon]